MLKSLIFTGCLLSSLITSAYAAQTTYVVGSGGTYRPFIGNGDARNNDVTITGIQCRKNSFPRRINQFDVKIFGFGDRLDNVDIKTFQLFLASPLPINVKRWWLSPPRISRRNSPS